MYGCAAFVLPSHIYFSMFLPLSTKSEICSCCHKKFFVQYKWRYLRFTYSCWTLTVTQIHFTLILIRHIFFTVVLMLFIFCSFELLHILWVRCHLVLMKMNSHGFTVIKSPLYLFLCRFTFTEKFRTSYLQSCDKGVTRDKIWLIWKKKVI